MIRGEGDVDGWGPPVGESERKARSGLGECGNGPGIGLSTREGFGLQEKINPKAKRSFKIDFELQKIPQIKKDFRK